MMAAGGFRARDQGRIMGVVSRLLVAATLGLSCLTLLTFAARYIWFAELATHFAYQYVLAAMVATGGFILLRKYRFAALALLLAIVHGASVAPLTFAQPDFHPDPHQELTVVQFNVKWTNRNIPAIAAWLAAESFDIVLLQEVVPALAAELTAWQSHYPYQLHEPSGTHAFGSALLSRYPLRHAEIRQLADGWNHYVFAQIEVAPGEPSINFYGLHAVPPMGSRRMALRNSQLAEVAAAVGEDPSPRKILMGDFNLTPYSPVFADLLTVTGLRNSLLGFGPQNSWPTRNPVGATPITRFMRLPIDHVLISDGIVIGERELGPHLGSDHRAVIATLQLGR